MRQRHLEEFHLLWMHFHNIYLLQRSIISEKYQVFIKFLRMAESQNTLVTLQFYLLKMNKKNCNQTSKQGIYFSTRLNPNWTKFYPKTYSIQILEWRSGSIYSLLNFRLSRKKYIIVIRRSSWSKVQQSNVTWPRAFIQTLIHFTPMMGVNAKSDTTCGF